MVNRKTSLSNILLSPILSKEIILRKANTLSWMAQLSPSTPKEAVVAAPVVEVREAEGVSTLKTLKVNTSPRLHRTLERTLKKMVKAMPEVGAGVEAEEVAMPLKILTTMNRALKIHTHVAEVAQEAGAVLKNAQMLNSSKRGKMNVTCMLAASLKVKQP